MPVTSVWRKAFVTLGATGETAEAMLALLRSLSASPAAFREWDHRLPPGAEQALLRALDAPDGKVFAAGILAQFRNQLMDSRGISEDEVAALLRGWGLN